MNSCALGVLADLDPHPSFCTCKYKKLGILGILILADLFLYYYDANFIQDLLRKKDKKLAISFNFTFLYIDGVLSLNNRNFGDYRNQLTFADT